jgi:hypothetical protein
VSMGAGQVTGTADKVYNVIRLVGRRLDNPLPLDRYVENAERPGDAVLSDGFHRAQESDKAERGGTRPH